MDDWIKVRGEAWVGSTGIWSGSPQALFPFGKLSVSPGKLTVSAFFDSYDFSPQDIVAFEPGVRLLRGIGFRIRHCVSNYPEYIVFRGLADPEQIIRCILATGFCPQGSLYSPTQASLRAGGGGPWRLWTILMPFLFLIVPFLFLEFSVFSSRNFDLLWKVFKILVAAVCIAGIVLPLATLKLPFLQRLFLKPGHNIREVRGSLRAAAFSWAVISLALLDRLLFRR